MVTHVPDFALIREQQAATISDRRKSPAFALPDRARLFRKRRFFKILTTICVLAAATIYAPFADARSPSSGDHANRAHQ